MSTRSAERVPVTAPLHETGGLSLPNAATAMNAGPRAAAERCMFKESDRNIAATQRIPHRPDQTYARSAAKQTVLANRDGLEFQPYPGSSQRATSATRITAEEMATAGVSHLHRTVNNVPIPTLIRPTTTVRAAMLAP